MKGIIHYYGNWETFKIPSHYSVWYIQWRLEQVAHVERMSAIAYPDRSPVSLTMLVQHIINVEKSEPKGISKNYKDFLK